MTPAQLKEATHADLARSGLTAEDAKILQLVPELHDGKPAYKIPYFDTSGKPAKFCRWKMLGTEQKPKYLQADGTLNDVYLPPYIDWRKHFAGNAPLVITEGEKKAVKATKEGIPTIGLGGVWCFAAKKRGIKLLPIFDTMNLKDRKVYICFDSDAINNPDILAAEMRLSNLLSMAGAQVFVCRLPDAKPKIGLDDYLLNHSVAEFVAAILDKAQPATMLGMLDFYFVHPANKAIYVPTGQLWPVDAVNSALPHIQVGTKENDKPVFQTPARWLALHRGVETINYDPSLPQIVKDVVAHPESGLVEHFGATMLNTYTPPKIELGNAVKGARWAAHVRKLYPNDNEGEHIILWFAHRVQRPGEKPRHALVLGGATGTGKDTIIEATLPSLGSWNCCAIDPPAIFSNFNEHAAKVLVRISEVVDLGDHSKFAFYEKSKTLIAGNPDFITINPKFGTKYSARNVAGVIMTTNYATTGMHLAPDDRRHFVVETPPWGTKDTREAYFKDFYRWLELEGGYGDVAAYLHSVSLDKFNAQVDPPKTQCFKKIVANSEAAHFWLLEALEELGSPKLLRLDALRKKCLAANASMTSESFNRCVTPALTRCGYTILVTAGSKENRFTLNSLEKAGAKTKTTLFHTCDCNVPMELKKLQKEVPKHATTKKF